MATYKTPGVYVEEIAKFPPSVAQVETAIPAFIGYTAKAKTSDALDSNDLIDVPTRITSLLEYENLFGLAQPEKGLSVKIIDTLVNGQSNRMVNAPEPVKTSPYAMYYAMQMYFANGGGPCYIVSVGVYAAWTDIANPPAAVFNDLKGGLTAIEKEDEPTLIVFPDANHLGTEAEMASLYNLALQQCAKLQDRFGIFDTKDDTLVSVDNFRDNIESSNDYNKYGAVYFPYLKSILNYQYNDTDITVEHISYSTGAMGTALTNLNSYNSDLPALLNGIRTLTPTSIAGSLNQVRAYITDAAANGFDVDNVYSFTPLKLDEFVTRLDTLIGKLTDTINLKKKVVIDAKSAIASVDTGAGAFRTAIETALAAFVALFEANNTVESVVKNLIDLEVKIKKVRNEADSAAAKKLLDGSGGTTINFIGEIKKLVDYSPAVTAYPSTPAFALAPNGDKLADVGPFLDTLIEKVSEASLYDVDNGEYNGRPLSSLDNATYNRVKQALTKLTVTVTPSSTMAGIYARVDSVNGVWKAPANVSVNFVVGPSLNISNDEQADLNVHTSGKSVNAIRAFTGKGTLVWGARTLAGNNAEWRYISVRRFFNMVEESTKKASEQFVFEGNDANTWVKLRAMLENYLILQWRAGALTGAKPEQAFYVRVGLGQTMTAQDILDGTMIVEIGMAVVRPAEFIVMRFSHKMQEA